MKVSFDFDLLLIVDLTETMLTLTLTWVQLPYHKLTRRWFPRKKFF